MIISTDESDEEETYKPYEGNGFGIDRSRNELEDQGRIEEQ